MGLRRWPGGVSICPLSKQAQRMYVVCRGWRNLAMTPPWGSGRGEAALLGTLPIRDVLLGALC